jgi:hypothetical protein
LSFVILLAALLTGCARLELASEFREDGTATHTVQLVFERAALDPAARAIVVQRLDTAEQIARDDGLGVTRIDSATELGLRVSNDVLDGEDAGAALNSIFNSLSGQPPTSPAAPFQGTFDRVSEAVGGTAFEVELTVDGDVLVATIGQFTPESRRIPQPNRLANELEIVYVVTMPGEIKETNGVLLDENTASWQLPFNSTMTMTAQSKLGESGSTAWFIIAAVASAAGVALLAVLVGAILLRRRRSGRTRLPVTAVAGGGVDDDASAAAVPEEPESLADVGSTLVRVVGRVVSGPPEEVAEPPSVVTDDNSNNALDRKP